MQIFRILLKNSLKIEFKTIRLIKNKRKDYLFCSFQTQCRITWKFSSIVQSTINYPIDPYISSISITSECQWSTEKLNE